MIPYLMAVQPTDPHPPTTHTSLLLPRYGSTSIPSPPSLNLPTTFKTPPNNPFICATSNGVNPVKLIYSPRPENAPVSGGASSPGFKCDVFVGGGGRRAERILARRRCRRWRSIERIWAGSGRSVGALCGERGEAVTCRRRRRIERRGVIGASMV